jgi:galactokinase
VDTIRHKLAEVFGIKPANEFAVRAPGRVNLIGEHTDYNGGYVCPMALDRTTRIVAAPRNDATIRMHSLLANQTVEFSIAREVPKDGPEWSLYAKGSAEAMRVRLPEKITRGFDCVVDSNVPLGGGLSSSAAFEVATALAVLTANHATMDRVELALACQWAEHTYPGVPCGIMDQFISAMGKAGHAMLLDCRDQSMRHVPLNQGNTSGGVRIVISNSNVKHELTGGEYRERREQCEVAVRQLQKKHPKVELLRDVTPQMLEDAKSNLGELVYRRSRHVVTEIARTIEFAASLEKQNYVNCGRLMLGSHASLRDDFEVSTPELDALVDIAQKVPGVYGARMTGGGFGGCIVALCKIDAVDALTEAIEDQYPNRAHGHSATTFSSVASDGASTEPVA